MFSLKIGRQCPPPPPPKNGKVEISGQGDILILADVPPPPHNEKVGFQVKVTFCFWLMYPPPPEIEIGLNMNAIGTKIISREVIKYILPIYPHFHYHYLILCLNRKLVNFNFKWIFGLEPHPPPFSSQKKMKYSFLDYVELLMIGRAGRWTRTPSTTLLQPKKK